MYCLYVYFPFKCYFSYNANFVFLRNAWQQFSYVEPSLDSSALLYIFLLLFLLINIFILCLEILQLQSVIITKIPFDLNHLTVAYISSCISNFSEVCMLVNLIGTGCGNYGYKY